MTLFSQALDHLWRNSIFHPDVTTGKIALGESRRFERGLDVHAEIDDVGNKLRMSLRLVEAAHDAEGNPPVATSA